MARYILLFLFCGSLLFLSELEAKPTEDVNKSVFGSTYDEIVVESTLTVRGKPGSRQSRAGGGKNLEVDSKQATNGATVQLSRPKRQQFNRRQRPHNNNFNNGFAGQGNRGQGFQGPRFPSGSASAANAASQGFQVQGPHGFGASASNAASQGFQFGPNGISGSAAQSASQVYNLPNGQSINVGFSNGFSAGQNGLSHSGANTVTVTGPNGNRRQVLG